MSASQLDIDRVANATEGAGKPFPVLATQNSIETEGTYPLPEAQVDRIMMKLAVRYHLREERRRILDQMASTSPWLEVDPVMSPREIVEARWVVDEIFKDDEIKDPVVDLTFAMREPVTYLLPMADWTQYLPSTGAALTFTGAKASAFLDGRSYFRPQEAKDVTPDVLLHCIIVNSEAEVEGKIPEDVVEVVLDHVSVP